MSLGEVLEKYYWRMGFDGEVKEITINFLRGHGWVVHHPNQYFVVGVGERTLNNRSLSVKFDETLTYGEGTYKPNWWQRMWHKKPHEMPVQLSRGNRRRSSL